MIGSLLKRLSLLLIIAVAIAGLIVGRAAAGSTSSFIEGVGGHNGAVAVQG